MKSSVWPALERGRQYAFPAGWVAVFATGVGLSEPLPSLDVAHLQSIVKLHIVSVVVRSLVVLAAVIVAIVTWRPGLGPSFERYILSTAGIFFWQRVLFGLLGPGLLSYLTWETAKIQSTQSATGILYVDFFTIIVGEVLAKYLLLSTTIPV